MDAIIINLEFSRDFLPNSLPTTPLFHSTHQLSIQLQFRESMEEEFGTVLDVETFKRKNDYMHKVLSIFVGVFIG